VYLASTLIAITTESLG